MMNSKNNVGFNDKPHPFCSNSSNNLNSAKLNDDSSQEVKGHNYKQIFQDHSKGVSVNQKKPVVASDPSVSSSDAEESNSSTGSVEYKHDDDGNFDVRDISQKIHIYPKADEDAELRKISKLSEKFFEEIISKSIKADISQVRLFKDDEAGVLRQMDEELKAPNDKKDPIVLRHSEEQKSFEERKIGEIGDQPRNLEDHGYKITKTYGEGAHGKVVRVRNKKGGYEAIKLYSKAKPESEKIFWSELCIFKLLLEDGAGYPILNFFELEDFFGISLYAGVGTLGDFKTYLRETNQELNEEELLCILNVLLRYNDFLHRVGFCHRDMKPDNVILCTDQLHILVIDYSFAISLSSSKNFKGWAGTKGYISPLIYRNAINLTSNDLIMGDLFSIVITILAITVPNFIPIQTDVLKQARKKVKKLNQMKMPKIKSVLSQLLELSVKENITKDIFEKEFQAIDEIITNSINSQESGLERFPDFIEYMNNKTHSQIPVVLKDVEKLQTRDQDFEQDLNINERIFLADEYFRKGLNADETGEVKDEDQNISLEDLKTAGQFYQLAGHNKKAILCYENLAKHCMKTGREGALLFCGEILALLKKEDIVCNELLYSTLGVILSQNGQIKDAFEMFKKGNEIADEEFEKIVLYNNCGCLTSFASKKDESSINKSFEMAYDIIKEIIPSIARNILDKWFKDRFRSLEEPSLHYFVHSKQNDRLFEILMSIHRPESNFESTKNYQNQSTTIYKHQSLKIYSMEEFSTHVFLNICVDRASVVANILARNNIPLLEQIKTFALSFHRQRLQYMGLEKKFEFFRNLVIFREIFYKDHDTLSLLPGKLEQEISMFKDKEEKLYALFCENTLEGVLKNFGQSDLFCVMIGFTVLYSSDSKNDSLEVDTLFEKFLFMSKFTNEFYLQSRQNIEEDLPNLKSDIQKEALKYKIRFEEEIDMPSLEIIPSFTIISDCKYRIDHSKDLKRLVWSVNYLKIEFFLIGYEDWAEVFNFLNVPKPVENISFRFMGLISFDPATYSGLKQCLQNSGKNLIKLELSFRTGFSYHDERGADKEIEDLVDGLCCCSTSLQHLRFIHSWCLLNPRAIKSLEIAIGDMSKLEKLEMAFEHCPNITEASILSMGSMIAKLPSLKELSFYFAACPQITNQTLNELAALIKSSLTLISVGISIAVESVESVESMFGDFL